MPSSENVLRTMHQSELFSRLTDEQFQVMISLLRPGQAKKGAHIVEPGYGNATLFVLKQGRAVVRTVDPSSMIELRSKVIGAGEPFNELAFVTGGRADESVEADLESNYWSIDHDDFMEMCSARPDIASVLVYSEAVRNAQSKLRAYTWLARGERVEVERRRHWWMFASKLWLPVLSAIGLMIGLWLAGAFMGLQLSWLWFPWMIGMPVWVVWHWLDWRNDYLVITDMRVVQREETLFLRAFQEELALEKVDNVRVERKGFWPLVFNYGTLRISATGVDSTIEFDKVHEPDVVRELIFRERQRVKAAKHSTEISKIRREVRVAMEIDALPAKPIAPAVLQKSFFRKEWDSFLKSIGEFRQTLLPKSRIEQDGGKKIIYRKHWFELVGTILAPTLVLLGILIGFSLVIYSGLAAGAPWLTAGIGLLLFIGTGIYWFYHYEDWRNDQFILEADRILDIDRKPFGLATSKREVSYERITSVQAEIVGFWDSTFNVGDVHIKTGGEGELSFNRVSDPQAIQQEVRKRVDAAQSRKLERDKNDRRNELAQWIHVYDEQSRLHYGREIARPSVPPPDEILG